MLHRLLTAVLVCGFCCAIVSGQTPGKAKKKAVKPSVPAATPDTSSAPVDDEDKNIPRVVPVFDPGSHTRMIRALGFNGNGSRLVTVGEDSSIQIWNTSTGDRVDILRLPSYGHDQGFSAAIWDVAAVSHDASLVAVGGRGKRDLSAEKDSAFARLLLIDIAKRSVTPVRGLSRPASAVAFSKDGRLAVATEGRNRDRIVLVYPNVAERDGAIRSRSTLTLKADGAGTDFGSLAFNADGTRLLGVTNRELFVWDVGSTEPKQVAKLDDLSVTNAVAWSPDGKRFARSFQQFGSNPNGFSHYAADGTLEREVHFPGDDNKKSRTRASGMQFLSPTDLFITHNEGSEENRNGSTATLYNLTNQQFRVLMKMPESGRFHVKGAVSSDLRLAAITTSMGLDSIVFRLADGKQVSRCGAASPVPTVVGWSNDIKAPAVAWSDVHKPGSFNTDASDLQYAFDLASMSPVGELDPARFRTSSLTQGEWSLKKTGANTLRMTQGKTQTGEVQSGNAVNAATLIPRGSEPPWFAWTTNWINEGYASVQIDRHDGKLVTRLQPRPLYTRDMVASPDGRFLLMSTGTHRMCLYAVDERQRFPLLSLARVNGEWVAWSGHGYYTASPGGEKLFGWAESHGPSEMATFHPAEKFAKHFRRPELLKRAIATGSWEEALKVVETRAPALDDILPPRAELKLLKQTGAKVQLQASAVSTVKDKPVVSMRLLLDGRPLTGGNGYRSVPAGAKAEAVWDIEVPSGPHELKLLARNDENSAVSDPLVVVGPKSVSQQPVLHRLCVGINTYQNPALNLTSAAKDARDVFAGLEQYCVGSNNRFGTARGLQLLDQQATRAAVLQAMGDIRKAAKPGDLVVFLFAGHGVKQKEEYYLLTHEADPSQDLTGKSLSGTDLRQALVGMECPVLLIMDACHSARGVKSFRPATDDLTRGLTDDDAGVTVMAAAMAHEVASATEENGHFTAAFLKALKLGQGVPYDTYEHLLYTHHIYSVVFSEVRRATNGKQNPFLNMPWTVPPLAIREVPR